MESKSSKDNSSYWSDLIDSKNPRQSSGEIYELTQDFITFKEVRIYCCSSLAIFKYQIIIKF